MESYKNILANKFMRDTNYIIIKDTDDLEELERQWELFNSQLTMRQQRLSDDRSIEIWDMTNKEHYEAQKIELMKDMDLQFGDHDETKQTFSYDPEEDEEEINDDDITSIINMSADDFNLPDDDNDITEPVKEESVIPIKDTPISSDDIKSSHSIIPRDLNKDNMADQYEIDQNINIVGSVKGNNIDDYLSNLEKSFINFNSQSHDHRKKSDDKCREIYGMSNIERYNKLKAEALKHKSMSTTKKIKSNDGESLDKSVEHKLEFVSQVYDNMQAVNEVESLKVNKHKRFNDTPYFTPTELIDMGVHSNHNFYSKDADNDGLITGIKVPTWFDSYKDMCLDHIFEDHRKDWIDTLDVLYSDFEDIKSSGDEEKILARKQSILDLGWNPEIPFNRKNRKKASERVSRILDETIPRDIFINLEDIPDDDIIEETISLTTHKPVFLIFVQGKTPIVSSGIKYFTKSDYSHSALAFDSKLDVIHSYNISGNGVVRESIAGYKDAIVSVMAFFAPNKIVESMQERIQDFENHKTDYDFSILVNKVFKIDKKLTNNEYKQVCSTFVDNVLQSGKVDLSKDINVPDPGQLYNSAKSIPNKIIEVYKGPADKYDAKKVDRKLKSLLKKNFLSIEEACKDLKSAREFVAKVGELAKKYDANYFIVTDGASGIHNNGNPAVKNARDSQIKWEREHGFDPDEDWSKEKLIKEATLPTGVTLRNATKDDTDNMFKWKIESVDKNIRNDPKTIKYIEKDVQDSIKDTKMIMYKNETIGMFTTCMLNDGYWYIGEIYIVKEHRNKGIGTALLKEEISKHDKIKLQVAQSNHSAMKLYKSLGFKITDRNDKGSLYIMTLDKKEKSIKESASILNEVKQFPVEFDREGNLIIYKSRINSLAFGDEIDDSVQLLQAYRNSSNIEGMKYELAKLWYINDCIEKKLKKRLTNDQYKELIDTRATCLNVFKTNLDYVMKAEKGFNFSDYYNSTPFSDNSTKISANTLKYTVKAVANVI